MDDGSARARQILTLDPIKLREFVGYYDAYQKPLIHHACDMLKYVYKVRDPDGVACDCVQETLMELAHSLRQGLGPFATSDRDPYYVRNWLFKVNENQVKEEMRKIRRYPPRGLDDIDDIQEVDGDDGDRLLERAFCDELLAKLDPIDAEILRLSIQEGLTSKEIAARLGMTDSTVRRRKKRALSRLRQWLEGSDP